MTGSPPDKAECIRATDPCTMVSAKPEDDTKGKTGNCWGGLTEELITEELVTAVGTGAAEVGRALETTKGNPVKLPGAGEQMP